jgi:threonine aldolase
MPERRKRAGHLVSKHRFVAAQLAAYCGDGLWLRLARHANDMADRLSARLSQAGVPPIWPVEANEVFVALPTRLDERLRSAGAIYSQWRTNGEDLGLPRDTRLVRLVTSFATTAAEVDSFTAILDAGC